MSAEGIFGQESSELFRNKQCWGRQPGIPGITQRRLCRSRLAPGPHLIKEEEMKDESHVHDEPLVSHTHTHTAQGTGVEEMTCHYRALYPEPIRAHHLPQYVGQCGSERGRNRGQYLLHLMYNDL